MKRIKLVAAYDGTNYHGSQIQKNGVTIEGVLQSELSELLKEDVLLIGASRTDAGVHAKGNVYVFDTKSRIPPEKFACALNARLPEDIRIQDSCEVPMEFHPRKQNTRKTYEYQIFNADYEDPTKRLYSHFVYVPLDEVRMQEAAKYLIGEHDFQSFCAAGGTAETTVRTIYDIRVERNGNLISIYVSGNGFLYNMVRIIAGTLIEVGKGRWEPEETERILTAKDRTQAGPTAPAKGLTLLEYQFDGERYF